MKLSFWIVTIIFIILTIANAYYMFKLEASNENKKASDFAILEFILIFIGFSMLMIIKSQM